MMAMQHQSVELVHVFGIDESLNGMNALIVS